MSRFLIMAGVAVAAAAAACAPQPEGTITGTTGTSVTVTLPVGDVAAGRQAFLDLKCTACHGVPSEPEFPRPVSANPGPPIDAGIAGSDASYVAAAVMTPSHAISPDTSPEVRANIEGVLSPMGDFSQVMTVRQMIDLQEYLRSIK
jgi:mono/diheme cytochrome c family protein